MFSFVSNPPTPHTLDRFFFLLICFESRFLVGCSKVGASWTIVAPRKARQSLKGVDWADFYAAPASTTVAAAPPGARTRTHARILSLSLSLTHTHTHTGQCCGICAHMRITHSHNHAAHADHTYLHVWCCVRGCVGLFVCLRVGVGERERERERVRVCWCVNVYVYVRACMRACVRSSSCACVCLRVCVYVVYEFVTAGSTGSALCE